MLIDKNSRTKIMNKGDFDGPVSMVAAIPFINYHKKSDHA